MDKFETQFEDLDVQSSYMENAMGSTTATAMPQDEVDLLMQKVADEAGLEMNANLTSAEAPKKIGPTEVEEDKLGERLRALRS
jgi:charged multivesicular body protein 1